MKFYLGLKGNEIHSGSLPDDIDPATELFWMTSYQIFDEHKSAANYNVVNGQLELKQDQIQQQSYTLDDAKLNKLRSVNAARLNANRSSFTFDGHEISCDALSRSDIDGVNGVVGATGALPVDWIGMWKTANNSYVSIPDVTTWNAFYAAMVAQGQANFLRAQELKAEVDAATTIEEVDLIESW